MATIFEKLNKSKILDRNRLRKICFYGRVSTENEAQLSALQNQMQWYDDQLRYHSNWVLVERYIDEGITGTQAKKRPAFLKMIEDAKEGKFDLIVTREVCRFARNTVDTLIYTRDLKNKYGVEVFFVEDNIWTMDGDGELRLTIMATMAQEESRKISDRVRAGQYISQKNGVIYGAKVLGYDRIGKTLVINEEEADTVRMIFQLYISGLGEHKIVNELNHLQRKTVHGTTTWNRASVNYILKNTIYKGVATYGKTYCESYLDQKRVHNNDATTYNYVQLDIPVIVSPEDWDKAQEIRESKCVRIGGVRGHGKKATKDIWMRKAICKCGSPFRKIRWRTNKKTDEIVYAYQCYRQANHGSKSFREKQGLSTEGYCGIKQVGEWKLDLMAKEIFYTIWQERSKHILTAYKMIIENYQSDEVDNSQKIETLTKKLDKVKRKIENLIGMRAEGELTKDEYISMRKKYDDEKASIESQIESIKNEQPVTEPTINLDAIREVLETAIDFSQTKLPEYIIETFVEKVVPVDNTMFRWYIDLNGGFGTKRTKEYLIGIGGRKNAPFFIDKDGNNRQPTCIDSSGYIYNKVGEYISFYFVIDFDMAQRYFTATHKRFYGKWTDIGVEVLLKI